MMIEMTLMSPVKALTVYLYNGVPEPLTSKSHPLQTPVLFDQIGDSDKDYLLSVLVELPSKTTKTMKSSYYYVSPIPNMAFGHTFVRRIQDDRDRERDRERVRNREEGRDAFRRLRSLEFDTN